MSSVEPVVVVQSGHAGNISSIAFSPDGRLIASGDLFSTICLWQADSGRMLRVFSTASLPDPGSVLSVAFSPDGATLVVGFSDGTVGFWETTTGQLRRSLALRRPCHFVAFSPDGKSLAGGYLTDKAVKVGLWDLGSGERIHTLERFESVVHDGVYSPDGKLLATSEWGRMTRIWEVATGRMLKVLDSRDPANPDNPDEIERYPLAFSPDGKVLALSGSGSRIELWDVGRGRMKQRLPYSTGTILAFAPDGLRLASDGDYRGIQLIDAVTGAESGLLPGPLGEFNRLAFSPDSRRLASGAEAGPITLWDPTTGKDLRTLAGTLDAVWEFAINRKASALLARVGAYDPNRPSDLTLKLWDLDGTAGCQRVPGVANNVRSFLLSPDDRQLVVGGDDGSLRLWELPQNLRAYDRWRPVSSPKPEKAARWPVVAMAGTPDGKLLATEHEDRTLRVWDLTSGRQRYELPPEDRSSLALDPAGETLFALTEQGVELRDAATGGLQAVLRNPHGHEAVRAALAPDGSTLATGSREGEIVLWDVRARTPRQRLAGHSDKIVSLGFSRDGRWLASGGYDQVVRLWLLEPGQKAVPHGKPLPTYAWWIEFHPTRPVLFAADALRPGGITAWAFAGPEPRLLCSLFSFKDGAWAVIAPDGRYDSSDAGDCEHLHWVAGQESFPLRQFRVQHYTPGLAHQMLGLVPQRVFPHRSRQRARSGAAPAAGSIRWPCGTQPLKRVNRAGL